VWDALATPLLLLPPTRRRTVLVLGLGGGSAARVVRTIAPRARIVGVEYSAQVLQAARRSFDLDELCVDIVRCDARRYLDRTRRRFDLVIEDVFVGSAHSVCKPDWLPDPGLARAAHCLHPGGVLVSNSIDETADVARAMRGLFPSTLRIDVEGYDNRVVVGGPRPITARALRTAVAGHRELSESLPLFSFRTLARR